MPRPNPSIGNRIAPPRFLAFALIALIAVPAASMWQGWALGIMIGFDLAAFVFVAICLPLLGDVGADAMRTAATRNDANRAMLLGLSAVITIAVLAAVATELDAPGRLRAWEIALVVATLVLAWLFANSVFTLHYAHLYYLPGDDGRDGGGLDVPEMKEPDYWDFVYFAFTLGMTFQTSDVQITSRTLRKVATVHSLLAFIFNLGVVALTVNVLGR
jgi:uncharacterized membrane protein